MDDFKLESNASPEVVAYALMALVSKAEGHPLSNIGTSGVKITRNMILNVYMECLEAVQGERRKRAQKAVE